MDIQTNGLDENLLDRTFGDGFISDEQLQHAQGGILGFIAVPWIAASVSAGTTGACNIGSLANSHSNLSQHLANLTAT